MSVKLNNQLLTIAIPMILSNITVPLLGLVDTAVLGHLSYAYYLGGSTLGVTIITLVSWLCGFLRMTTTGLSAQAFGAKQAEQSAHVLLRGLAVAAFIGIVMIVMQTPYISFALTLAGGSSEVQFYAQQYSEIRIWGLPAALMNLVLIGWLLGQHQAKVVMWLLIATNVINLAGDVVLVVVFDWKVAGVATATLIAEYSCLLAALYCAIRLNPALKQVMQIINVNLIERQALTNYFKLNRDILIRTLALQACFVFITFQGARLGDIVVASNAILMNFLLFISFGLDGIANAAEVMVGKAKGANKQRLLGIVIQISLKWTLLFAAIYSVMFLLFGGQLLAMITSIEPVLDFALQFLPWMVLLPLLACWSYLLDGIYIGLTQAKVMRNSMVLSTFLGFFPLWWLLQGFDNHGLWAAFCGFMISRAITLGWDLRRRLAAPQTIFA